MKRSFATNVDGQIFYMDEDAFNLLQDYLHQLKETFKGTEGEEIVGDIESRIRELFAEKINAGASVIVIMDVQNVIERMGRPEDINGDAEYADVESQSESGSEKSQATPPPFEDQQKSSAKTFSFSIPSNGKKLYRSSKDHVFGGVFGGLAVYLGWNANIMRLLYTVLAVFTYFIPCLVVYLVAWMIIPEARTPKQKLQMYGEPVNVGTVGETVIRESSVTPPPLDEEEKENGLGSALRVLGNCVAGVVGIITGFIVFGLIIAVLVFLTGIISAVFFNYSAVLTSLNIFHNDWHLVALICCSLVLALIVFGAILWGCCALLFNVRKASKTLMIIGLVSSVLLIAAICILGLTI